MNDDTDEQPDPGKVTPRATHNANLLRQFLSHNEVACPDCGYNLYQLMGDICPECGRRFALRVDAVEPRFGTLLALLVPLLMSVAISCIILVALTIHGLPPTSASWGLYVIALVGFLNALVVLWIYRSCTVLGRHARILRALAVLAWIVIALIYAVAFEFGM